jgi:uncharacterized protein YkwD
MQVILFLFSLLFVEPLTKQEMSSPGSLSGEVCLSPNEKELYNLLMQYRKSKKLPAIPLSKALTLVAQTHSKDLYENRPDQDPCNQHSWSDKGTWKPCCYYPDHRNKECMWDKPKELTNYSSPGFEIAYFHSAKAVPTDALDAWKKSQGHNAVIINLGMWKKQQWNAIGLSIYKNYATVWFGMQTDAEGPPSVCTE